MDIQKGKLNVPDNGEYKVIYPETSADQVVYGEDGEKVSIVISDFRDSVSHIAFNVKDYGVVGDGVTDDTDAIQSLINNMPTDGGTLLFPVGVYLITSQVTLTNNLVLRGENSRKSILQHSGGNFNYIFTSNGNDNITLDNLVLRGLKNHNNLPDANEFGYGLRFDNNSDNLFVNNCVFENFYYTGLSLRNVTNCFVFNCFFKEHNTNAIAMTGTIDNVIVDSCNFESNHYHNVNAENSNYDNKVENIQIKNNKFIGTGNGWCINFSTGNTIKEGAIKYRKINISNNFISNTRKGVNFKNVEESYVINNIISDNLEVSIDFLQGSEFCKNSKIHGNTIKNSGNGIRLGGASFFSILDNNIENVSTFGISGEFHNTTIQSNSFSFTTRSGMRLMPCGFYNKINNNYFVDTGIQAIEIYGEGNNVFNEFKNNTFNETAGGENTQYCFIFRSLTNNVLIDNNVKINVTNLNGTTNIGQSVEFKNTTSW